jgi:Na+/H+ antiporter NhaD/arsenite permease-like protein
MAQLKDRWRFMTVRLSLRMVGAGVAAAWLLRARTLGRADLRGGVWLWCCWQWRRGHRISTREVLLHAPWQIVIFSLGMYLVVYGLRNAGLTAYLTAALDWCAQYGVWSAAMGTGFLTAILSSIMNNLPTVLVGALSVATTTHGAVREAMIYANVIGSDLGRRSRRSAAWRRCFGCTCWPTKARVSRGATTSAWGLF